MSKDENRDGMTDSPAKKKKRPGRIVLIILLILIIVAGIITFLTGREGGPNRGKPGIEEAGETVFAVTVTDAVSGHIRDLLEVNGDVIPDSSVDLYADNSGKLARLYVELGDYVRKGQIIAEVDPSKPGMSYTANPVKAEISGTVTSLPFDIGDTVSTQVPVATIGKLQHLQVRTYIPERFISRISLGMKADLSFEAYPGEEFSAEVSELSPVVDELSRTMEIKMDLTDESGKIKAGMYAKISLITEVKENIVRIPSDCIMDRFGETFVFVMDGDEKVARRIVKEGIRIGGVSEITEGLDEGETIIYQGQTLLDDGAPVKVVRSTQPLQ